jgi:flagellar hook-associated protein 1 FlgK
MSSLFAILGSTAQTLQTFTKALGVSTENIANVATPGYARQLQSFTALPFDPGTGLIGGVTTSEIQSARNLFAEANVQAQTSQLGFAQQQVTSLTNLQTDFDISGTTGIPAALNALSTAFSNWSITPNDQTARSNVMEAAQNVASAFQATSANVSQIAVANQTQAVSLVSQANGYAANIAADNAKIQSGDRNDPSISADIYNNLENLSQIANVSSLTQADGSITVSLGGQTTLVAGSQSYPLAAITSLPTVPPPTYPGAPPNTQILDSQGNDVTSKITEGQLGGVLTVLNQTLPAIEGDSTQVGSLNQLAQSFADKVNTTLSSGNVTDGPPVQTGSNLFSYDSTNATNAAASLSVASGATAAGLAAIAPADATATPPTAEVANGTALALAGLATAANGIDGQSFSQNFGNIAAGVGTALSSATTAQTEQTSLLAQAQSLRATAQGVDLNQEAVTVTELQTSIDAASKVFSVIDQLTQTIINLIQ